MTDILAEEDVKEIRHRAVFNASGRVKAITTVCDSHELLRRQVQDLLRWVRESKASRERALAKVPAAHYTERDQYYVAIQVLEKVLAEAARLGLAAEEGT